MDVIDLRGDGQSAEDTDYATCEMCGREEIRFVHVMEHEDHEKLEVGCVCAENMAGDKVGPRRRETKLKNRAIRRTKWLSRKWRTSAKGNPFLNVSGYNLVVFSNNRTPEKWSYGIDGDFSKKRFDSVDAAKLALFDTFWELTEGPNIV